MAEHSRTANHLRPLVPDPMALIVLGRICLQMIGQIRLSQVPPIRPPAGEVVELTSREAHEIWLVSSPPDIGVRTLRVRFNRSVG